jgi:hypothetical protein
MNLSAPASGETFSQSQFCGRGYLSLGLMTGACAGACNFCLSSSKLVKLYYKIGAWVREAITVPIDVHQNWGNDR